MTQAWNADLPITAVDPDARTFTCQIDGDVWAFVQSAPTLVDGCTIRFHVPDTDASGDPVDQPYVEVGQTLHFSSRLS